MPRFLVPDMSCQHCVNAITAALKHVAPEAEVNIDLTRKEVRIEHARASDDALRTAIAEAGYEASPIAMS